MKHDLKTVALGLLITIMAAQMSVAAPTAHTDPASQAINALGLDLLANGTVAEKNAVFSPFSIQTALAMTYAGAAGRTRAEMAKVLHYSEDEATLHESFAALQKTLEELERREAERTAKRRGSGDPVIVTAANRLFGQAGYQFHGTFLSLVKETYKAPFQSIDFANNPSAAIREINAWVEGSTHQRIRDLLGPDALDRETCLVLVNAIYLKAPWADSFPTDATHPRPFQLIGGKTQDVPTMTREGQFGYAKRDGLTVVTIPYSGGDLQFLVLLPDETNALATLERKVTPDVLKDCSGVQSKDLILHLPKFKLEPPVVGLSKVLKALGMNSAFDVPRGSADFSRMASRKADDYLRISEVFHKTFLALDERGTEAAAATAVAMVRVASARPKADPIEVRVDHPFLFAIQHRPTGMCLFLGRVTDPR